MRRKINILYLITAFNIGGAEMVVARTVKRLDKNKYNITVAALAKDSGRLIDELKTPGVQIIDMGMEFKYDVRGLYKLYSRLKQMGIDIIYAHLYHPSILSRIIGKIANVPISISCKHWARRESDLRTGLDKLTHRYSDAVVVVSKAVYEFCRDELGVPDSKLVLIHNGVEIEKYACNRVYKSDNFVIGCTARLHEINGHRYLIEAAKMLKHKNLRYRFIGTGEEELNLRKQVEENQLKDSISFIGYRSDIPNQLAMLDIYVQPSLSAGISCSILEAMASGLPVIATNVGGTKEAIIDGQTGLLVPMRDSKAIAEKISYLIEHPDVAHRIGNNAKAYVKEKFSVESMVEKTEALFTSLLQSKLGLRYDKSNGCWL